MPRTEPHHPEVGFERSDISARGTFITGVCVLVGLWLTVGLIFFYFTGLKNYRASVSQPPLRYGNRVPPEPRLQRNPREDLKSFQAHEDYELGHYHWLDKNKGIVAIPIDKAIAIVAARGIPPQRTPGNASMTPPEEGTRLTGFEGKVAPEPR